MMKKFLKYILLAAACIGMTGCGDLSSLNDDPNNPSSVPSNMLMSGAEKWAMDKIYDEWFSARLYLVFSQQWAQRNYTEEDRYQIRENVINKYFDALYQGVANFMKVSELNTDESTKSANASYGANTNQAAAATIMKVWLMSIITDTWGNVPYSEVARLESDGIVYCKYDDQKDIYQGMISELTEAVGMIDESQKAFTGGDVIFSGDATKWKRFGNSLKCRLAIHLSKVDSRWRTYIAEALQSGVMQSNDDAAAFKYSTSGQDYCRFYKYFFVDGRNDFTISRPLTDIMKGQPDTLNAKSHPWPGTLDPRLSIYTTPNSDGVYQGIPYSCPSGTQDKFAASAPNWYTNPPLLLQKDYAVPLMTYAELQFILCEYNGYDAASYREGVSASIDYWYALAGKTISAEEKAAYIDAVSQRVDAETCALQKYIDLYTNGTEAWTELRRTGYPEQLIRPGEICAMSGGSAITFTPLSEVKNDIVARVKYPTNESTLNATNWAAAVAKLTDATNNYYSKMYWDVRTSTYDHPANLASPSAP